MKYPILAAMTVLAISLAAPAPASPVAFPDSVEAAIAAYVEELARVEASADRVSIEPLFSMAYALPDLLTDHPYGEDMVLEQLSDEEFEDLDRRLRGLSLIRTDIVAGLLESEMFDTLAKAKGLPADTAALGLYRREYEGENGVAPEYIEWRALGGCTRFGSGLLVQYYRAWSAYRVRYPGQYEFLVANELQRIEEELLEGFCVCDTTASAVVRELELFLREFPKNPVVPDVEGRLQAIREGQVRLKFNCSPG